MARKQKRRNNQPKVSPFEFQNRKSGPGRTRGPPCCPKAKPYDAPCSAVCRKDRKGRYPQWGGGLTWVLIQNSQWLQSQNNYLLANGSGVY